VVFLVLLFRLGYLQLSRGDHYFDLSEHNFVQEQRLPALRGNVYDCDDHVLADNRPTYNVYLTPAFVKAPERMLLLLENYLSLSPEEALRLRHALEGARGLQRFRDILVKVDISRDQLAMMESRKMDLDGVNVRPEPRRNYPEGELFGHSIGYVGRINEKERKRLPEYHAHAFLGKRSIELQWEKYLRGIDGFVKIVVDAHGRRKGPRQSQVLIKGEKLRNPIPGVNLYLSLDYELQKKAEELMAEKRAGSVVVLDVETGFVKVWFSKPGFDPNKFVGGISHFDWQSYRDSILEPLIDKATQASYYPGSVYKPIGALAALEEGKIDEKERVTCYGVRKFGERNFHCWKRAGHGSLNMIEAIQRSCDVYFYDIGERLGHQLLFDYAARFGLGQIPGLGIKQETAGVLPSDKWHKKAHGRRWFPGDTLSHVIGQGDLKTSPLQLARMYAAIANGGKLWKTQVIERVEGPDNSLLKEFRPELTRQIELTPENLEIVKEGLRRVVNERGGTAYISRLKTPQFSGKTGTAQVVRLNRLADSEDTYILQDHAWFAAYAPSEEPKIAVIVQVEHGKHGSWAAPIARDMIAAWWEKYTGEKAERP